MTASELYRAGNLGGAIQALVAELRDNPADQKRRIFLFELLCFAGEYERAEKHLDVLAGGGPDAMTGTLLYRAAIAAERSRNDLFAKKEYPLAAAEPVKGKLNGKPFESLEDADPRLGPRVEIYAAGQYMWMPLAQIESITIQPPKRLRDLLWAPSLVKTGPKCRAIELGEVLVPVLSPFTFRQADDAVRLGRATVWEEPEGGEPVPYGQKMLLVDGEEFPLLEVRSIEIAAGETEEVQQSHASAE